MYAARGLNRRVTVTPDVKRMTAMTIGASVMCVPRFSSPESRPPGHQGAVPAQPAAGSAFSNDALFGQCCRFGCGIGSACMHALNDCFAQSNRFRKAYRAADRRWLRQVCQHQTNACAVQPQGNPRGNVSRTAYHD
ncbi:MAG: hypothetical protein ACLUDF_04815 [Butyricicoccus sp.]